jgi:hypothetical protein
VSTEPSAQRLAGIEVVTDPTMPPGTFELRPKPAYPPGRPARVTDGNSLLVGFVSASHLAHGRVFVEVTVITQAGSHVLSGIVDHAGRGRFADKYPVLVDGPHPLIPPEVTIDHVGNQVIPAGFGGGRGFDRWVACAGECGYLVGMSEWAARVWHESCRPREQDKPVVGADAPS